MMVVEFRGVWEKYRIKFIQKKNIFWEELWALENINFAVNKGQVIGIIGENGAGKTTLLKLIAGMLVPDRGEVYVQGKVSALMELGAGFNPEFTGRENIILNARVYGLDEDLLEQRIIEIIEFAGLGKFIDAPIKYYSQGMYMRLVFALAIYVKPDVLLIDDILAVGDEEAQQKCIKKIFQLKQTGKTIIVVSHDMNMIGKLCDHVILLDRGKIVQQGSPQEVIPRYLEVVGDKNGIAVLEKEKLRVVFNNGRVSISYNRVALTKGMGGYVSFFVPVLNAWFSSLNLDWQIKNYGTNEIILEGLNHDGTVVQTWEIRMQADHLEWRVELKDVSIKQPHIDLLLVPDYKGWASLEKDGDFGLFMHKTNWQEIGSDIYLNNIVGIRADLTETHLPFLILETKNKDNQLKLLNAGYNQEARIIQSHSIGSNYISMKIKVFSDANIFEDYIKQLRNEFLIKQQQAQAQLHIKQQAELARLRAMHTICSGHLRLFADIEAKSLRLYYKDKEITKSSGLHISFIFNQTWHDTSSCDWQVEKQKNTLILSLIWKQPRLSSTWRFSIKDNCLIWQADSKFSGPLELGLFKIGLSVIPEYKSFFCGHQQTDFPEQFTQWQDIALEEPRAELFGLRKLVQLPAICLENSQNLSCLIQNSDAQVSCRTLQLNLPKQSLTKKKISFSTKLSLLEDEALIDNYIKKEKQKLLLKQQQAQARLLIKQQAELTQLRAKQQTELIRLRTSRTITSGQLRLFADIETKSLRLYYKDREITKSSGLHLSFLSNQTWYDTYSCDWQVEKQKDTLILSLIWKQPRLSSTWRFSIKDNCLIWQADSELSQPLEIKMLKFGLSIIPEYKSFFAAHQQGNFPEQFTYWQDMSLEEPRAELFGLRKTTGLPALYLKNNQSFSCLIQNSDAQVSCRTLQLNLPKQSLTKKKISFSTKLSLLEDEALIDNYIKKEKQKLLLKQQQAQARLLIKQQAELTQLRAKQQTELIRLRTSRTITSGQLRLFADIETKSLRLYYKDREITRGNGWYTSMYVGEEKTRVNSFNAQWQINKISNKELDLILDYKSLYLRQIWRLRWRKDNTLENKIEMEVNKQVSLNNQDIILEVSGEYKDWKTAYEKGNFFVKQYINNIGPVTLKDNKVSTVILESETDRLLPFLAFYASSKYETRILGICKRKEEKDEIICFDFSAVIPKKEQIIMPGRHSYFEGKIILDKEVRLKQSAPVRLAKLNKDKLRFIFNRGKGGIFWKNRELTKGLSLYTSVRTSGIWYDSYQAVWQVIENRKNKIVAVGDWPYIPISQTWELELIDKNLIHWKVMMEIYEELDLELEQANLMLCSEYKTWMIPDVNKGEFLDEYTQDYDIFPFRFWYGKAPEGGIGAINKILPCILFRCNLKNDCYHAILENTDNLYRARLLQYQKINIDKSSPKKYNYFEGVIEIGSKG